MSAARSNKYAWIVICLASIFISSKIGATSFASEVTSHSTEPLKISLPLDESFGLSNSHKNLVSRSADDDTENTLNKDDEKVTEKPPKDTSEETTPPPSNHHEHGSHGPLGPVKHLLNTVRERFHGNGGGPLGRIGAITSILGARHEATTHESPIETEKDRTSSNSSTGLHVLEFLGTLFAQIWGFLSNIPAVLGSSSNSSGGRGQ
ncbi:uncharacterized protein LOC129918399 isoform X1 [Episyrphus balteatus]|uniref:uncharacterized protein LOC129918399 isoform X1 n=1 Tax=Episyrphus balteatus TaxID=286459 RepID=UPI00248503F0|nr:uncharacterized protein LOC129918399 isoform X1 [Episyrphus balteatus]